MILPFRAPGSRHDPRFDEWVDDRLDRHERQAFERVLAEDDELRGELDAYAAPVHMLRHLPPVSAPPGLLRGVQRRIRRQSRGRWYGHASVSTRLRFPWEATFNIVLIALLFATYLGAVPPRDPQPAPVDVAMFRLGGGSYDTGASVLATYGELKVVAGSLTEDGVAYRVTVQRERLTGLRSELALYPGLSLQGVPLPDVDPGLLQVRVYAERGR